LPKATEVKKSKAQKEAKPTAEETSEMKGKKALQADV
jgi:hypothetical protein